MVSPHVQAKRRRPFFMSRRSLSHAVGFSSFRTFEENKRFARFVKKRVKIATPPLHSERPSAFRRDARRFGGKLFSVNDTETAPKKQERF